MANTSRLNNTMLRTRRIIFLFIGSVLTVWFIIVSIFNENNVESVFYRVWFLNGFPISSEASDINCYDNRTYNTLKEFHLPVRYDTSIFFLETSCHTSQGVHLTPRQACAVESAAKMNPDSEVYVLFPSPIVDNSSASSLSVQQLFRYPNVKLRHVTMEKYFQDTPLESWYKSGMLRTSRWPRSHASDILRYLTLWKFGGIYLDLDVVVTRSLKDMINFAGAESNFDVAAGVLSFSHKGNGHDLATSCLTELRKDFRGYDWGYNGPGVITRMLKKNCKTNNIQEMTPELCKGFTVYPSSYFYPIPWRLWQLYFETNSSETVLRRLKDSHAIHVWNKFSTFANISVGSTQPYGVIANQYCPHVYNNVGVVF